MKGESREGGVLSIGILISEQLKAAEQISVAASNRCEMKHFIQGKEGSADFPKSQISSPENSNSNSNAFRISKKKRSSHLHSAYEPTPCHQIECK